VRLSSQARQLRLRVIARRRPLYVAASRTRAVLPGGEVPIYWDETAPDMLTFALSGPGWGAAALFVAVCGIWLARFAEFGPRRAVTTFHCLRVLASRSLRVELSSGAITEIPANAERIIRESTFDAIDAVARKVEQAASRVGAECSYTLYRANGDALVPLRQYPRRVDAATATGWIEDGNRTQGDDKNARWDEYARMGNYSSIEKEWKSVMQGLGGVTRETAESRDTCKLCGGKGFQRCSRCMGASANGTVTCEKCIDGRVPCSWCTKNMA
jgi:hypothetical protein